MALLSSTMQNNHLKIKIKDFRVYSSNFDIYYIIDKKGNNLYKKKTL